VVQSSASCLADCLAGCKAVQAQAYACLLTCLSRCRAAELALAAEREAASASRANLERLQKEKIELQHRMEEQVGWAGAVSQV